MDLLPRAFYEQLQDQRPLRRRGHAIEQDPDSRDRPLPRPRRAGTRVTGDYAICAIPFSVLRDIEVLTTPFSREKQKAIRELNYNASTQDPLPGPAPVLGGGGRDRRRHDRHRPADPAHLLPVVPRPGRRARHAARVVHVGPGRAALGRDGRGDAIEQALEDVAQIHPADPRRVRGRRRRTTGTTTRTRAARSRCSSPSSRRGSRPTSSRPRAGSTSPASTRRCTTRGSRARSSRGSAPRGRSTRRGHGARRVLVAVARADGVSAQGAGEQAIRSSPAASRGAGRGSCVDRLGARGPCPPPASRARPAAFSWRTAILDLPVGGCPAAPFEQGHRALGMPKQISPRPPNGALMEESADRAIGGLGDAARFRIGEAAQQRRTVLTGRRPESSSTIASRSRASSPGGPCRRSGGAQASWATFRDVPGAGWPALSRS